MNLIWKREMNYGSYRPKWLSCTVGDETIRALAFTVNRQCSGYAGQIPQEDFVDHRLHLLAGSAADGQGRLEIAARKPLLQRLPDRRLEPLKTLRQPQPDLDALAVDGLDLPGDRGAVVLADGACKSGHALQIHDAARVS